MLLFEYEKGLQSYSHSKLFLNSLKHFNCSLEFFSTYTSQYSSFKQFPATKKVQGLAEMH